MDKLRPVTTVWHAVLPCLILSILLLAGSALGTTYYVKTDGNDAGAGTSLGTAWRTVARADTVVVAGDTVLISPGTYQETTRTHSFYGVSYYCVLRPSHSGTAANPIVFKGNGGKPILRGVYDGSYNNAGGTGSITCSINSQDYITLDSLQFVVSNAGGVIISGAHTTIKNCLIDSVYMVDENFANCAGIMSGEWGPAVGDGLVVSNCEIYRTGPITTLGSENNYDGIVLYDGDSVLITGNRFQTMPGVGVKLKSLNAQYVITIENNIISDCGYGIDLGPATDGNGDSIVVTGNILYDIGFDSYDDDYSQQGAIIQGALSAGGINNSRVWIYNNTIDLNIGGAAVGYETGKWIAGFSSQFFNNIIWDHNASSALKSIEAGKPTAALYSDYNLFYGRGENDDLFWYASPTNSWHSSGTYYTLSEWQSNLLPEVTGKDANSEIVDPMFVDGANHDYSLRPGSPALTGGRGGAYPTYRGALGVSIPVTPDTAISIGDAPPVSEGGDLNFPVTMGSILESPCVITYNTANGTAVAPGDYTAVASNQLTIPAGSTTGSISIATVDDSLLEFAEKMTVTLTNATIGTLARAAAEGTIIDNDSILSSEMSRITIFDTMTVSGTYSGYVEEVIVDNEMDDPYGGTTTTWASDAADYEARWIMISFDHPLALTGITIYWAWNSFQSSWTTSQQYQIQGWDGATFVDLATVSNAVAASLTSTVFPPYVTNSLRIYQPAGQGPVDYNAIMWLTEVQMWGPLDTIPPAAVNDLR